jgi:hypothetical protein
MKTKLLLSALLIFNFCLLYSQVPQGFNYQAIARDGSGNPIVNATIKVKLSILTDTSGFYATGSGTYLWEEEQTNVKTNAFGLFTVVFGNPTATKIQGPATSFSAIDWAKTPLYIGTKIANPTDYKNLGTAQLWSVPYSMVADSTKALIKGKKLSVVSSDDGATEALFEVKRKDGQTVFAVYPNAVNIYVPRTAKGTKGGFAIGGFEGSKTDPQDYFRVTPDSVRIYIDKTPTLKGSTKGGFAIGGFDQVKGWRQDLLTVSKDSVRIYIDKTPAVKGATKGGFAIGGFDQVKGGTQDLLTVSNDSIRMYINDLFGKGTKGGFAIGGFDHVKGLTTSYLNVATESNGIVNPSQNRILWYPIKNAFLVGRVKIEKPDSVGINSFASGYESKAIGNYSQSLGYMTRSFGTNSTAIGNSAQSIGNSSFAFGDGAVAYGLGSYAFGAVGRDTAGNIVNNQTVASGNHSVSIGLGAKASNNLSLAFGTNVVSSGISSIAMGYGSTADTTYAIALGKSSIASEYAAFSAGYASTATGRGAIAMGYIAKAPGRYSNAIGYRTQAQGEGSTAIGYQNEASLLYSTALGGLNTASGESATVMGSLSVASGYGSFASGYRNKASGTGSVSLGYQSAATGNYSTAIGYLAKASGYRTISLGTGIDVSGYYSAAIACGYYDGTILAQDYTLGLLGYVGINMLTPTYALQLPNISSIGSGQARAYAFTTYSDSRVKKNEISFNYGMKEIMQLTPRKYNHYSSEMKNDMLILSDEYEPAIGLFAQEVYEIIPEVVAKPADDNKELWGLNYEKLVPVLIKGMQEQQEQIESARQENLQLKSELQSLREEVEQIKAMLPKAGVK